MRSTPDHRAVKRVLMQNILLQNMFCINDVTPVEAYFRLKSSIECPGYLLVELFRSPLSSIGPFAGKGDLRGHC
jgi:hypothetical protein